jgi:predicted RNase H-like nuclease (RuvC/YqgF family)
VKTILPWCVALALLAGMVVFFMSGQTKESELIRLRQDNQQLAAVRTENEALKKVQPQVEELARLRKENEELHRLRNEVRQLREEKQQAAKTSQSAQQAAAQSRLDAASQQQVQQQLQQQLAENAQLRAHIQAAAQVDAQLNAQINNTCINNLRIIDGAKQQWALENKKTAETVPTVRDLLPYLKDQVFPVCPSGGAYTVKAVSLVPVCSVAGHVLAQ